MDPRFDDDQSTGTLAGFGPPTERFVTSRPEPPSWLQEARAGLGGPGRYVAFEQDGQVKVVPVSREWTRIGRSLAADIRFDDATVSRRHALIACEEGGVRVLDDRSLNGVYVNGERVDWAPLTDGDEIAIGRHTIHYFDTATVGSGASAPAAFAE